MMEVCFTVKDLLDNAVAARPGHIAIVDQDRELTYAEFGTEASRVHAWLIKAGMLRGDRVGISLSKSWQEAAATFGVAYAGGVFVNINYQWSLEQLDFVSQDSQVHLLITDRRRAEALQSKGLLSRFRRILVTDGFCDGMDFWQTLPDQSALASPSIGHDLAALLYTSGSTGKPKGVMLTHTNIVQGAKIIASYLKNTSDDRVLSVPPFSFDYGLNQLMTMTLVKGTLVLQRVPMPSEIVRTAIERRVTGIPLVAPSWVQVSRYLAEARVHFPDLRYVTNTGGKIPSSALATMREVFQHVEIFLMYGLTEAFRSTYLPPELFDRKIGAIGRAIPNVEIYVVHPEKGLCGPGEIGELIHRGDLISLGYWNRPEDTAAKIRPNPHLKHLIGDEKVLHSGDDVYRDEDGILWFVGRRDAMIKCSGHHLSPTEVEEIISAHPSVADVIAFGIPDDELGQVVHVAVTCPNGHLDDRGLIRFCREHMPSYMVPRRVHLLGADMPRTSSGKLDRTTVIRQLTALTEAASEHP